jgi:Thioredoxin.
VVLTDENFTEGIKDKEALVIFYYSQCGSSRFAFDEFKKAALYFNNTENFVMGSIDIYNYPNVPKAFQVYTNPKILFFLMRTIMSTSFLLQPKISYHMLSQN